MPLFQAGAVCHDGQRLTGTASRRASLENLGASPASLGPFMQLCLRAEIGS